ncbi:hypothetical protein KM043_009951 [Ampulex compressa]|nr:hypothetical protein KM043_009951 [Ampulex compressa]
MPRVGGRGGEGRRLDSSATNSRDTRGLYAEITGASAQVHRGRVSGTGAGGLAAIRELRGVALLTAASWTRTGRAGERPRRPLAPPDAATTAWRNLTLGEPHSGRRSIPGPPPPPPRVLPEERDTC